MNKEDKITFFKIEPKGRSEQKRPYTPVFLNSRAAARYRVLASIIPGLERFFWN
jgi:hypothetical protein